MLFHLSGYSPEKSWKIIYQSQSGVGRVGVEVGGGEEKSILRCTKFLVLCRYSLKVKTKKLLKIATTKQTESVCNLPDDQKGELKQRK